MALIVDGDHRVHVFHLIYIYYAFCIMKVKCLPDNHFNVKRFVIGCDP